MTIPNLVQDVQDAQFKTAWKKTLADFSQVSKRFASESGGDLSGMFGAVDNYPGSNNLRDPFLKYLNYTKSCDRSTGTGTDRCWHKPDYWYNLNGQSAGWPNADYANYSTIILNNGSLVMFRLKSINCTNTETVNNDSCGTLTIDINGFKGPNKVGKDIYGCFLLKNGSIKPMGYSEANTNKNTCTSTNSGWSCSYDFLLQ